MEIPYYVLLLIYLAGLLGIMFFALLNFYHIVKFGILDFMGRYNLYLTLAVILLILGLTILFLKDIPWLETFDPFNLIKINFFS